MAEAPRIIAVFDFDHTLIKGESFWAFLGLAAGWPRTVMALAESAVLLVLRRYKDNNDPAIADIRTFIKSHLLMRLLAGHSPDKFAPAREKLRRWRAWNEPVHAALLDHHAQGHHIVIASGGLDLYLQELLKDLPHDAVVCTNLEIKDGVITGTMLSGNCVRQRKAELVTDYITTHGPFADSWGYGNLPHDLPMLELLKNRIVV